MENKIIKESRDSVINEINELYSLLIELALVNDRNLIEKIVRNFEDALDIMLYSFHEDLRNAKSKK